jgi:hypothetical protein
MVILTFTDNFSKKITIDIQSINYLFKNYEYLYKRIFHLNNQRFEKTKIYKIEKSGFLVRIFQDRELASFFSITKSIDHYYELGDVAKVLYKFPRSTFSECLTQASSFFLKKNKVDGIFGFPNQLALPLELSAGYTIQTYYKKIFYIILFNILILLPFSFYQNKLSLNKNFFRKKIFFFSRNIDETSNLFLNIIKIYKKNLGFKKNKLIKFGVLCDYELDKENGYPFIFFGKKSFPLDSVKYEISENSL